MSLEIKSVVHILVQHQNRLFAYMWSIVGDAQLAEDALQELSVLAVEKGIEVADEQRLVVWLWRAARLKALEWRRQKYLAPIVLDEAVAEQLEHHWLTGANASDSNRLEALDQCIQSLSQHQRQMLNLRYTKGKKAGEIADLLHRKAATVYQSIARLHRILRDCIDRRLREDNANA